MSSEPETSAAPEITSVEPEPEPTSEPENLSGSLPESIIFLPRGSISDDSIAWPEPEPEWDTAFKDWGVAWPLHVYIFGLCYTFAFIFAAVCILSLIKTLKAGKGRLTVSLLAMVILFNITRAVSLFTDPYFAFSNIDVLSARIIWSIGLPFLTSSFSLVFLVLLDTTKMDIGPPKFQKFPTIIIITVIHIIIVVTADFVVSYNSDAKAILMLCQGLFCAYGLTLAIGYLYVGIKMRQNCAAGAMNESKTINRLILLCYVSSAISVLIVATHIYSAVGVFGVYSTETTVESWPWWILQTFLRIEELLSVGVVLTIASNSDQLKEFFGRICRRKTTVKPLSVIPAAENKTVELSKYATVTKTTWSS